MVVVAALVQRQRVLEPGATATADADPQADVALGALPLHELGDLLAAMSVSVTIGPHDIGQAVDTLEGDAQRS